MTDLVAEISLNYKIERQKPYSAHKICRSGSAVEAIRQYYDQNNYSVEHREIMGAIYLNNRNNILGFNLVSVGAVDGTMCDPRIIFQGALKCNCTSIMLFHNHPSGGEIPSNNDVQLTRKIQEGCKILGYKLLDHLIITTNGYFSMTDENII